MTVGGAFVYVHVKTCERGRVKDFEPTSHVYSALRYNAFFVRGPRRPHYNGIAVYCELLNIFTGQTHFV